MSGYWSWWMGALALGTITVVHQLVLGRRLGVSGAVERVVHWRTEREAERVEANLAEIDFSAELEAATREAFGEVDDSSVATVTTTEHFSDAVTTRLPVAGQLVLIVMIGLGALVAALVNGRFDIRSDMGPAFSALVVDGPLMWPVLFGGGLLVGVGTRMAGGCSSGHGLSGCSRLQPMSLLATCVFFATAVVVSMLLWKVI